VKTNGREPNENKQSWISKAFSSPNAAPRPAAQPQPAQPPAGPPVVPPPPVDQRVSDATTGNR
jgi:hypothetical protein